jgi:hypothetical protein
MIKKLAGIDSLTYKYDWLQAFYVEEEKLKKEIGTLKEKLDYEGQLWISWPKKSSKLKSNLTDQVVRDIGLKSGLVDTKIVAIDETWSGLKFVYRLSDRK